MEICYDGHDEICFDSLKCPICEKLEIISHLEDRISELEQLNEELSEELN